MGQEQEAELRRRIFAGYQVNARAARARARSLGDALPAGAPRRGDHRRRARRTAQHRASTRPRTASTARRRSSSGCCRLTGPGAGRPAPPASARLRSLRASLAASFSSARLSFRPLHADEPRRRGPSVCPRPRSSMQPAGAERGREKQVPQLAPGWERRGTHGSRPAEGFLLSRIDGTTPWTLLREIGGLAPGEADRCLERWVAEGLVIVSGSEAVAIRPRPDARGERAPRGGESPSRRSIPGSRSRSRPSGACCSSRPASSGPITSCSGWARASTRRPSSAPISSSRRSTTRIATTGGRSVSTPRSSTGSSRRSSRPTSC